MSPKSSQILPIRERGQLIALFSFEIKLEMLSYFVVVAVLSDSISATGDAFAVDKDSAKHHNSPRPVQVNTPAAGLSAETHRHVSSRQHLLCQPEHLQFSSFMRYFSKLGKALTVPSSSLKLGPLPDHMASIVLVRSRKAS